RSVHSSARLVFESSEMRNAGSQKRVRCIDRSAKAYRCQADGTFVRGIGRGSDGFQFEHKAHNRHWNSRRPCSTRTRNTMPNVHMLHVYSVPTPAVKAIDPASDCGN